VSVCTCETTGHCRACEPQRQQQQLVTLTALAGRVSRQPVRGYVIGDTRCELVVQELEAGPELARFGVAFATAGQALNDALDAFLAALLADIFELTDETEGMTIDELIPGIDAVLAGWTAEKERLSEGRQ
jgi:hypothetical protein